LKIVGTLPLGFKGALIPFYRLDAQWGIVGLGQFFSEIIDVFGEFDGLEQNGLFFKLNLASFLLFLVHGRQVENLF
jgi:hypothetical protein